jgi:DNA repair exonuclease SbcCD ATPase subunit
MPKAGKSGKAGKSSKKSKDTGSKESLGSAKELAKKVEEMTLAMETLKTENEELRVKYRTVCKKVVDSSDMSTYSFLEPDVDPEQVHLNDILHMIQTLVLLASQLPENNLENHCEKLEMRVTELSNENSSYFKNKLKLQERLEFIMQERDVWKRNADTLKKMYAKLGKSFFLTKLTSCIF